MEKGLAFFISLIIGLLTFQIMNMVLSVRENMDPTVDPVVTDPVVTDPVVTDPVVTDPVVTDPVVTDGNGGGGRPGSGGGGRPGVPTITPRPPGEFVPGSGGGRGGGGGFGRRRHPYFWSRGTGDGRNPIWDYYYYPQIPYYGNQVVVQEPEPAAAPQPEPEKRNVSWSSALIVIGVVVLGLSSAMKK